MNFSILLSLSTYITIALALPPTLPFTTPQLTTITLSLPPISHASTPQLTTITVTIPPLSTTTPSPPPPPPPPTGSSRISEPIGTPSPITIPVGTHSLPTSILLSLPPPVQTPAISIITPSSIPTQIWISEPIGTLSLITRTSVPIGSLSSFSTATNTPIGTLTTILLSPPPPGQTGSTPVASPSSIAGEVWISEAIGTLSSGIRISEPIETLSPITKTSIPIGTFPPSVVAPPSSPTCTIGTPVTIEPSGWVVTFAAVTPSATPNSPISPDTTFVIDSTWGKEHRIGSASIVGGEIGYSEFKCQFACRGPPNDGCVGWFFGYDSVVDGLGCVQYDALIPGEALVEVEVSGTNGSLGGGRAFNAICK